MSPTLYPARRRWSRRLTLAALVLALATACPLPAQDPSAQSEDLAAIADLRDAGFDLSQPLWLEFAFHFPSLEGAQRAWNRLAGQGFKGKLEPAGGGRDYLLFASKRVLVDEPTLLALREQFEALARENGGSYEGWGVP